MKNAKNFFSEKDKKEIVDAIAQAELNTSGEIRVHIEDNCKADAFDRAVVLFKNLGMNKTALKNGVLFYFAVADRKFAIVADKGINDLVPEGFWEETKTQMLKDFSGKHFVAGLCKAIIKTGNRLKEFFPLDANDRNELSNEISTG
jgi:uncharacterized membrane protein